MTLFFDRILDCNIFQQHNSAQWLGFFVIPAISSNQGCVFFQCNSVVERIEQVVIEPGG